MRPQITLEFTEVRVSDRLRAESIAADQSLSRSISSSRLNARAPEFVPRVAPAQAAEMNRVKIHHHHQQLLHRHPHPHQPAAAVHIVYHHPPPSPVSPPYAVYHPHPEYYGSGIGEQEADLDQAPAAQPQRDGLSEEVAQKITKQVCSFLSVCLFFILLLQ